MWLFDKEMQDGTVMDELLWSPYVRAVPSFLVSFLVYSLAFLLSFRFAVTHAFFQ